MEHGWIYALVSVAIVSVASLAGAFSFIFSSNVVRRLVFFTVSFAAGSLLGGAFLHLLPEAVEDGGMTLSISLWTLAGILAFFLLEKFLAWRHCHHPTTDDHPHHLGTMNLVGDGLHNLLDGLIIGAAFLADLELGIATTIAVVLHEIPQEIADLGILLYAGISRIRAILLNLLSACAAFLGVGLALIIGDSALPVLLPLTAGAFIYIAGADLIPELQKETKVLVSAVQFLLFSAGLALMLVLRLVFECC
jgi:zinc and cadmium transporter